MKLALPQLGDLVAPRFEAASRFLLVTLEGGRVAERQEIECSGPEGYRRVRLLQIHGVAVLVCSGIRRSCRDMLVGSGITVIPNVTGTVTDAVEQFVSGRLQEEVSSEDSAEPCAVPHGDLVRQARTLFQQHGYVVSPGPGPDAFLIDLVAQLECPICHRPVRVAVCCAAHTYRSTEEIIEFHYASATGYHAKVYFSPAQPGASRCCREYGIEHIDPEEHDNSGQADASVIPLLRGPITDHEKASQMENRE